MFADAAMELKSDPDYRPGQFHPRFNHDDSEGYDVSNCAVSAGGETGTVRVSGNEVAIETRAPSLTADEALSILRAVKASAGYPDRERCSAPHRTERPVPGKGYGRRPRFTPFVGAFEVDPSAGVP